MPEQTACQRCGRLTEAHSPRRRWCSSACRSAAYHDRRRDELALLLQQSTALRHGDHATAEALAIRAERLHVSR